ncbi:MAG: substrate binding domain-containing protein, partial [Cyanobacteria bacterium P01_F01_bin.42]
SLILRKLAADQRILVAAPSYLEQHGTPLKPDDLQAHYCFTFTENARWKFQNGQEISVPRSFIVNDGEAMRIMIEKGMGIGLKSVWNASKSLTSGHLVKVLPNYPLVTTAALWILYPSRRILAPKVSAMIDFLSQKFQPIPPWAQEPSFNEPLN